MGNPSIAAASWTGFLVFVGRIEWTTLTTSTRCAVRAGIHRSQFNEHSEALYLTSSFVFENAAQAAARFANEEPGNIYSRFTNPTVTAFQERLAALEGAEACVATASGMSAILACVHGADEGRRPRRFLARAIFGATVQLFTQRPVEVRRRDDVRRRRRRRGVAARDAAEHAAPVPRDAVEPADRGARHRRARRGRARARARCSRSTTASARRRCSGRSSSARTW